MNERIRELIAQAREPLHNRDLPFNQGLMEYSEKFAELIVRDCAQVADQWVNDEDNGHNLVSAKLKKHFGVEECTN